MYKEASEVRYERIYKLLEWRKYKEATEEAMAVIREEPEDASGYAVLAQICLRMDRHDEAKQWTEEALRKDPDNHLAWFVRSVIFYENNQWKELENTLVDAQRIDPYEPYYYFLHANLYNKDGKFQQAKQRLSDGLAISPDHALLLAALSYTEALLGEIEPSKQHARQALRLDVESYTVFMYLGWAAEQRSDYDEQLQMLANAIRLEPTDKQIRDEYLSALQRSYKLYRIILAPANAIKRFKPWQVLVGWLLAWILFKPLVLLFLVLYVATHWVTKLLVHVKVFGWSFRR
ncbi:tetratricopeptide repeat protein [Paenibacillus chungangensis]|uniref:Tetratricopeptide repeat protein n=1 Tax=Paenibacillus chungangensis TaxID=696535 RepID=A0ABW3HTN2_9BACL